jgi:hypothetical protein
MKIIMPDGSPMLLPEEAECLCSGDSPERMHDCPMSMFDDWGNTCIPLKCPHYRNPENLQ